ncbi:chemotaxis protein [Trinickia fusca]|uniref:Chemotaxis signal transduction protein CheV n=1 Tax=Trinickia fusca TaxID=2419777 RepID=A0A494XBK9_9BURK|nr:chemotaxis protein [Trinickia fusca]RKP48145.1 chemotaxis signal transduction protein CheV [Trinickia fusca]
MSHADVLQDERTKLTSRNKFELLLFRLGVARPGTEPGLYGINVFKVREIITNRSVTPIAGAAGAISGALEIRGQIVPVIDLCRLTGNTPTREPSILLITEFARTTQAFAVEDVDDIVRLDWNQVHPAECAGANTYVMSIARFNGDSGELRLAQVLDVEQVMRDVFPEQHPDIDQSAVKAAMKYAGGGKIIAADDSAFARTLLGQALTAIGAAHTLANTGEEAWQLLLRYADEAAKENVPVREKVPLVITDLEMPEMDGFMLTRKIKADQRFRHIPVLIHSSLTGAANEAHVRNAGADGYIAKFDPEELCSAICEALAS